jgi:Tol biopolymer transport system component
MLSRADHILGVAWSSDERRIVFSSESNNGALWETSLARPSQIEMLPVGHDASDLAAAPGSRLAYVQGSTNVNIWRLDLFASPPQVRKLVTSSREQLAPSISPDGSEIAFASTRSGASEIWVCDADGSNAQKVTDFRHTSTGTPRWSPDGKLIAFDSRAGGEANVYVVDPRGGVPHKVNIDMHGNNVPSWSHDGAWIYFVNGEDTHNSTVWKVPSNGGHAVQIAARAAFPLESPDGVFVYFVRDSKLWRVRTDGSNEEQVAGMPQFKSLGDEWFPTEAGIYFLSHANGKTVINLLDLKTRKVQPIFTLEKTTPVWIGGMPVSNDGKFMLFPQVDQSSSDLMLIENWR